MSEIEATARNVYLLQKSMQDVIAERDKLQAVCQRFWARVFNDNGDMTINTGDLGDRTLENDIVDAYFAMKKYNR